jgi:hypothetical protein
MRNPGSVSREKRATVARFRNGTSQLLRALMRRIAYALCILTVASANAQTPNPIRIDGYPQPLPQILGTAWQIFAGGIIDRGATQRLRDFLVSNRVPSRSLLYLNSNGGNLLEGMRLGRLIREYSLYTYIGTKGDPLFRRPLFQGESGRML